MIDFVAASSSESGGIGINLIRIADALAIVVGVLLLTNFRRCATRLYHVLTRLANPGMATVGTLRAVGGVAIFVGVFSFTPDVIQLFK